MVIFALTTTKTPLFNTRDLTSLFSTPLGFDAQFLLRPLETILFPKSLLTIKSVFGNVLEVESVDYPSSKPLYVDRRFIIETETPRRALRTLPKSSLLKERLISYPKLPYVWGGNTRSGIPELFSYYPPQRALSPYEWLSWHFRGVDCSGLLYDVSNGITPRNTKELSEFGYEVTSPKPLDIAIWPGHVLIFIDKNHLIESKVGDGLTFSKAKDRLKELEKIPYQIRRWV
jgi:hypothetical protein